MAMGLLTGSISSTFALGQLQDIAYAVGDTAGRSMGLAGVAAANVTTGLTTIFAAWAGKRVLKGVKREKNEKRILRKVLKAKKAEAKNNPEVEKLRKIMENPRTQTGEIIDEAYQAIVSQEKIKTIDEQPMTADEKNAKAAKTAVAIKIGLNMLPYIIYTGAMMTGWGRENIVNGVQSINSVLPLPEHIMSELAIFHVGFNATSAVIARPLCGLHERLYHMDLNKFKEGTLRHRAATKLKNGALKIDPLPKQKSKHESWLENHLGR